MKKGVGDGAPGSPGDARKMLDSFVISETTVHLAPSRARVLVNGRVWA